MPAASASGDVSTSCVGSGLTDGEDYDLLYTFSGRADRTRLAQKWKQAFPRIKLTCIGRFQIKSAHAKNQLNLESYHGFEHLR